jgi:hypothetical protein
MDRAGEVLITGVEAIGTTTDCRHAYVQCQFQDGKLHTLFFTPELASPVCGAFLSATAQLQKRRNTPGAPVVTVPIKVDRAFFSLAKRPGIRNALMVTFATSSGAELQFELSDEVAHRLAAEFPAALLKLEISAPPLQH